MDTLQRLERDALRGDADATLRWADALRRRNQRPTQAQVRAILAATADDDLVRVCLALDAVSHAVSRLELAWKRGARAADAMARTLGIALDASGRQGLDALVERANGRARTRLIGREHLVEAMVQARLAPHGLGWSHGGEGPMQARTGIVVAVRDDERDQLVIGATRGGARTTSPGRGWPALQPWSRDVVRNVERALAWARTPADDRLAVPLIALRGATEALLEARAEVENDVLARLATGAPGRQAFNELVSHINKLPDPEAATRAVAEVERLIAPWSPAVRAGGAQWLRSLAVDHRKKRWRPGWQLIRRLELSRTDARRLADGALTPLLASPFCDTLVEISLGDLPATALTAVFAAHPWPALRRLVVGAASRLATTRAIAAMPEALLGRVAQLSLLGNEFAERLPADGWPGATPDALELALTDILHAKTTHAWLAPLNAWLAAGALEAVRLADWKWFELLEHLDDIGAMTSCRHLAVEAERLDARLLTRHLEAASWTGQLETLALDARDHVSPLAHVARIPALVGVRRVAYSDSVTCTMLDALSRHPLGVGLEILVVDTLDDGLTPALVRLLDTEAMRDLRVLVLRDVQAEGALGGGGAVLPASLERVVVLVDDPDRAAHWATRSLEGAARLEIAYQDAP